MEDKRKNIKISFRTIWEGIMSIVYVVLAYLFAFTPYLLPYNFRQTGDDLDDFFIPRAILSIGLFLYGIYRGYRIIKLYK